MDISFASEEVFKERLHTCQTCEKFSLGLCTNCGCVMILKAKLAASTCPEDKWSAETPT